jgi:hypothetical protein
MLPAMMSGIGGEVHTVNLTLYTDTHIVRASYATRQRRISDILNESETDFIVVRDASFDDFGTSTQPMRAEYAQINLGAVLFAVVVDPVEPVPELRTPKVAERALISIPPFRVVGNVHILPERNLQESLEELIGRFLPVTDAQFWSDRVGEARQTAAMVAINHARAQISRRIAKPTRGPGSIAPGRHPPYRRPSPSQPPIRPRWSNRCPSPAATPMAGPSPTSTASPARLELSYRSTGRSSRLPHSAQPPSYTATSS